MRRTGLIMMLTLISMSALAQTNDERLKREIDAREAEVSSLLDTVTAVKFNEDCITGTLWVNDFADMIKAMSEIPMDTTLWEDVLAWLLPESEKDMARLVFASPEGVSIDVNASENYRARYIQRFRTHGFTYDAKESEMYGIKLFEARNAKGDRQCAVTDMGGGRLSVSVEAVKTDAELKAELEQRTGEAQRKAKEAEYNDLMKQFL